MTRFYEIGGLRSRSTKGLVTCRPSPSNRIPNRSKCRSDLIRTREQALHLCNSTTVPVLFFVGKYLLDLCQQQRPRAAAIFIFTFKLNVFANSGTDRCPATKFTPINKAVHASSEGLCSRTTRTSSQASAKTLFLNDKKEQLGICCP
jgi:hypothetical protein